MPDRLLHRFRLFAGLPVKDSLYGGWEAETLSGHTLGHYLSACAMMYTSTGNIAFKNNVDYIVNELRRCQLARKTGSSYITPGHLCKNGILIRYSPYITCFSGQLAAT